MTDRALRELWAAHRRDPGRRAELLASLKRAGLSWGRVDLHAADVDPTPRDDAFAGRLYAARTFCGKASNLVSPKHPESADPPLCMACLRTDRWKAIAGALGLDVRCTCPRPKAVEAQAPGTRIVRDEAGHGWVACLRCNGLR